MGETLLLGVAGGLLLVGDGCEELAGGLDIGAELLSLGLPESVVSVSSERGRGSAPQPLRATRLKIEAVNR